MTKLKWIRSEKRMLGFWNEVKKLEGKTLKTLDRGNTFIILVVSDYGVIVKPLATDKEWLVPRSEIEGAYRELFSNKEITRALIESKYSPRNPVYIAAILAELPGVWYTIRPIHLRLESE